MYFVLVSKFFPFYWRLKLLQWKPKYCSNSFNNDRDAHVHSLRTGSSGSFQCAGHLIQWWRLTKPQVYNGTTVVRTSSSLVPVVNSTPVVHLLVGSNCARTIITHQYWVLASVYVLFQYMIERSIYVLTLCHYWTLSSCTKTLHHNRVPTLAAAYQYWIPLTPNIFLCTQYHCLALRIYISCQRSLVIATRWPPVSSDPLLRGVSAPREVSPSYWFGCCAIYFMLFFLH